MVFNIKAPRIHAELTQMQLACKLGYKTNSIIAMWESGDRNPPSDKLPKIAEALGIKVSDLYFNTTTNDTTKTV